MWFGRKKPEDPMVTWLRGLAPFSELDDRTLEIVNKLCRREQRRAGSTLTKQGGFGHEAFVVASGQVDILQDDKIINTVTAGDYLGELSMKDRSKQTATAVAKTKVDLAVFNRDDFLHMLSYVPVLAAQVERVAEERRDR